MHVCLCVYSVRCFPTSNLKPQTSNNADHTPKQKKIKQCQQKKKDKDTKYKHTHKKKKEKKNNAILRKKQICAKCAVVLTHSLHAAKVFYNKNTNARQTRKTKHNTAQYNTIQ